jgi:putative lipoprotein
VLKAAAVAILLALPVPALAAKVSLSGQVTYREKVDLPAPAKLRIQLVDESLPSAPPRLDVEAPIATGQVPLSFTLTFEDAIIIPDHSYALIAAISAGGKLIFRNFQPYAVDPLAPTAPVSIIANLVAATQSSAPREASASSAEPADTPPPAILGTLWTATQIGDAKVTARYAPTLSIDPNLRAGGTGGCNSWFAVTELEKDTIKVGDIAATKKSCSTDRDAAEQAYFTALGQAATWSVAGDTLTLYDAGATPVLTFARN